MNLTANLKILRARKNVNPRIIASQTLPTGLTIEAKLEGRWLLSRAGVKPAKLEVEIVARDSGMNNGFTVRTGPASDKSDLSVYSLVTPGTDAPELATLTLCPDCTARSLMRDPDGDGRYCPECGHNSSAPKPLAPLPVEEVQSAMFETLGAESPVPAAATPEVKPRTGRAFFDSQRSATSLGLEARSPEPSVKLEDRTRLVERLMERAQHLTPLGQDLRRKYLVGLGDHDLMLEVQIIGRDLNFLPLEFDGTQDTSTLTVPKRDCELIAWIREPSVKPSLRLEKAHRNALLEMLEKLEHNHGLQGRLHELQQNRSRWEYADFVFEQSVRHAQIEIGELYETHRDTLLTFKLVLELEVQA